MAVPTADPPPSSTAGLAVSSSGTARSGLHDLDAILIDTSALTAPASVAQSCSVGDVLRSQPRLADFIPRIRGVTAAAPREHWSHTSPASALPAAAASGLEVALRVGPELDPRVVIIMAATRFAW